jgi:hypothetical protein
VLYIDRYKNVVLSITRKQFEKIAANRPFTIKLRKVGDITALSARYNDVPEEAPLCRFNSAGFMEIAINHGHAASLLGLDTIEASELKYQSIRIFF